jgi:hypothetical protein
MLVGMPSKVAKQGKTQQPNRRKELTGSIA